jgi:Asp-tRNA(Asn)/Glu-tRNA(Gln) amidotransferase A subunit family amidase
MLRVIAGWDPRDPYALPLAARDFGDGLDAGVKGLRIAYSPALGYARVAPEVGKLTEAAARSLEFQGAIVENADPGFSSPRDAFWSLWSASCAKVVAGLSEAQRALLDPGLRVAADHGRVLSAVDLVNAEVERALLAQKANAFLTRYDVLLTPTVAVPALPVAQDLNDPEAEEIWIDWARSAATTSSCASHGPTRRFTPSSCRPLPEPSRPPIDGGRSPEGRRMRRQLCVARIDAYSGPKAIGAGNLPWERRGAEPDRPPGQAPRT